MDWTFWLDYRRTLFSPLPHWNSNGDFHGAAVTQFPNADMMVLSDAKVRSGRWCIAFSVNPFQDVTRFDARDIRGASLEHVQEHPFSFAVDTYITKAGIDRVLWKQFLG